MGPSTHTHPSLQRQEHRPWPIPPVPWRWRQTWHDLLFLHWQVPADVLRPLIPPALSIDQRDGAGWLGLVPFWMSGVTFRGIPPIPWLSSFAEMNLRTYVTHDGRPGVWFFRMDASRALAVAAARLGLGLPYVWSDMSVGIAPGPSVRYRSRRGETVFEADYEPTGSAQEPVPGSFEWFLVERYCLYACYRRMLLTVDIHHVPWPLQPARARIAANSIARSLRLPDAGSDTLLHYAARQDVIGWSARIVRQTC